MTAARSTGRLDQGPPAAWPVALGRPRPPPQGHELQGLGQQHPMGIVQAGGLELEAAEDQGAVVMERAAQRQRQLQGLPCPPALGQGPAAGGVEQIAAVRGLSVDPQFGRLGPPTQHQAGPQLPPGPPGLRADEALAQAQLLATAGPDDQPPGEPVGPVAPAPGVIDGQRLQAAARALHPPVGVEIAAGT